MTLDLAALKYELQTDPAGLGYAPHVASGADAILVQLLNEPRAGVSVNAGVVGAADVVAAIDQAEYMAIIDPGAREYVRLVVTPGLVDLGQGSKARVGLLALFPVGTATRAALVKLVTREASRAEFLGFGPVSDDDIATALRG